MTRNGGTAEYIWGKRGDVEAKNPVKRKNQPKPPCCSCDDGTNGPDGSDLRGTCALNPERVCMYDWHCNVTAGYEGPCQFGGSGHCYFDHSKHCSDDRQCDKKGPCVTQAREGVCAKDTARPCDSNTHCHGDGSEFDTDSADVGPCSFPGTGTCAKNAAKHCMTDEQCNRAGDDSGPCKLAGGSESGGGGGLGG